MKEKDRITNNPPEAEHKQIICPFCSGLDVRLKDKWYCYNCGAQWEKDAKIR